MFSGIRYSDERVSPPPFLGCPLFLIPPPPLSLPDPADAHLLFPRDSRVRDRRDTGTVYSILPMGLQGPT